MPNFGRTVAPAEDQPPPELTTVQKKLQEAIQETRAPAHGLIGGLLSVESVPGHGTIVTCRFPLVQKSK
jgi:signal transduction histidine kinase